MSFKTQSGLRGILVLATLLSIGCGDGVDERNAEPDSLAASDADLLTSMSIGRLIETEPQFSVLATALDSSGMKQNLEGPGPFTLFAPTDEAFQSLSQDSVSMLLMPEHRERLQNVVLYHVADGRIAPDALPPDSTAASLQGNSLLITRQDGRLTVNGVQVTGPPIEAGNGVIYVIDTMLKPEFAPDR